MQKATLFLPFLLVTIGACRSEPSPSSTTGTTGASVAPPTGEFTTFMQDYASTSTFRTKYPAGKPFTVHAKALQPGSCGRAKCSIKVGDSEKSFMSLELAPDQKNVESIKEGQAVTIACTPEYQEKVMWLGAGCTVK